MTEIKKSNIYSETVQRAREHKLNGVPFAPIPLGMEDIVEFYPAIALYMKLFRLANAHEGQGEYVTMRTIAKSFTIPWRLEKVKKAKDELVSKGYLDYTEEYIGQSAKGTPLYKYQWTQYYERRERTEVEKAEDKLLHEQMQTSLSQPPAEQQALFYQPSNIQQEVVAVGIPMDTVYGTRSAIRNRAKEFCGSLISQTMLNKLDMAFAIAGGVMTEEQLQLLLSRYYAEDVTEQAQTK